MKEHDVFMSFSTDILHGGHLRIIAQAAQYGNVIAGVLTDEVVASYKRYPLIGLEERMSLFRNLKDVSRVVVQDTLSYRKIIETYRPKYVAHGDDWLTGFQKPLRDEAAALLAEYGGEIIDLPYSNDEKYQEIVDFSGLHRFIDVPLKNYSSGMRSRLGFSIATVVDPDILILDEVLSVGDARFRKKSEQKVTNMFQEGVTVLFVSHSLRQVMRLCNKAMILDRGKLLAFGDIDYVAPIYARMLDS